MFQRLQRINERPKAFEFYTAETLWNDKYISKNMLDSHLNPDWDAASRKKEFIDRSVEWLVSHFGICDTSRICDFGCGPGLYTTQFAERGAIVTAIDFSERSIDYARGAAEAKGLNIAYILQDYLQFSTDKQFDIITMIYRDFSVLSPAQRACLLKKFHQLLCDDGSLVIDVDSMVRYNKATESVWYELHPEGGFWSPDSHHVFNVIFKYPQEKVVLDKCTIVERDREREVFMWNQCFSIDSIKTEFRENGLQVVESYSDVAGAQFSDDASEFAVVATKST